MPRSKPPQPPLPTALTPPPAHLVPIPDAPLTSSVSPERTADPATATHTLATAGSPRTPAPTNSAHTASSASPANPAPLTDPAFLTDPAQQAIARAKYQALHDQISTTRETLPGDDTANRTLLRDRAEEAQDVLTTLDRNDLQSNTPAFTAAATQIQQTNADMAKLSDSIGGIIHNIQAVADFVQIANEAISAATKFIA